MSDNRRWYTDDSSNEKIDYPVHEYDIAASPNDFNIMTLFNFIEQETIRIPGFQRNYVWDIKRASKLIESIIIGLPIPQIFLYEEGRNKFSVIDGQQRLMSIYYFIKQRFPLVRKRSEIRRIFELEGKIPEHIFENDDYFTTFRLRLSTPTPNQRNKFNGMTYSMLDEYQASFNLRPMRTIIVKQVSPSDDDSAVFELFNRLNSGGINLTPQEIRTSLYHSDFYDMLYRVNVDQRWRRFTGIIEPDMHMKDVEFILRGFAMLILGEANYTSSMARFLNEFSRSAKEFKSEAIGYFEKLFLSFLDACNELPSDIFFGATKRFSITIFESVFVAVCQKAMIENRTVSGYVNLDSVEELKSDQQFLEASERATTGKRNVVNRLSRARELIRVH